VGIVFAIASATWLGGVGSRAVDPATNQLASDLRLAHTSAANRLTRWQVVLAADDSTTYQIGPEGGTLSTRTLSDNTWYPGRVSCIYLGTWAAGTSV
jgi:Tfp pilus assembly protein FimT